MTKGEVAEVQKQIMTGRFIQVLDHNWSRTFLVDRLETTLEIIQRQRLEAEWMDFPLVGSKVDVKRLISLKEGKGKGQHYSGYKAPI